MESTLAEVAPSDAAAVLQARIRGSQTRRRLNPTSTSVVQRAKQAGQRAYQRGAAGLSHALERLDERLEDFEDQADLRAKRAIDDAQKKVIRKILAAVGKSVRAMSQPAYMPEWACKSLEYAWAKAWPEIAAEFEASMMLSYGYGAEALRDKRLLFWPEEPVLRFNWDQWWQLRQLRRTWRWLRAKILYAITPADANKFRHIHARDPIALGIMLLKLNTAYGINVLIFILNFVAIDRSDEYQLVGFILSFKSFQFVSGHHRRRTRTRLARAAAHSTPARARSPLT